MSAVLWLFQPLFLPPLRWFYVEWPLARLRKDHPPRGHKGCKPDPPFR